MSNAQYEVTQQQVTRRNSILQRYEGPDRREPVRSRAEAIGLAMDEIDHAILVLDRDGRVVHRNYLATVELDESHPLAVHDRELQARNARDAELLQRTLKAARDQGFRRLITLRHAGEQIAVSVVPLGAGSTGDDVLTLVMLGKRRLFDEVASLSFARCHGLSPAEARVVHGLCNGGAPAELAARAGVKISTVRTQISSIRSKTGVRTVTELVRSVAALPPLIGALRMAGAARPI